jgi:hypothetical protein
MNATNGERKESASCPMDFILRMLMGPWTTYILYNLKTHGPISMRRMKSIGQEALSLAGPSFVIIILSLGYETVPTGKYIARFLILSSHFG